MSSKVLAKEDHKYMQDSKDVAPFKNWFVNSCVGKSECHLELDKMKIMDYSIYKHIGISYDLFFPQYICAHHTVTQIERSI